MSNQGCDLHTPIRTTVGCLRAAPACTAQGTATVVSVCNIPTPSPTRLTYTYPTCTNIPQTTSLKGDCYVTDLLSLPSCPTETAGYSSTTLTFVDHFWRNGCLRETASPITVYEVLKWPGPTPPANAPSSDDTPSRTIALLTSTTSATLQTSTTPPSTTSTTTSTTSPPTDQTSTLTSEPKTANVGLIVGITAATTLSIIAIVIGVGCWYRRTRFGSPSGMKGRDTGAPLVPEYRAEMVREVPRAYREFS
ncbi:hypothetical protein HK097_005137 [Rhizophlyctis rosea]|uniref:Uncharacterized protein n=1 Tax=Rhizophlyctis rosea TaxID=64517 RepID=A0AAD5SF48_9FUNG|nr:hypothetical protein HK097_005137 [Rhizophlyctis rosea]